MNGIYELSNIKKKGFFILFSLSRLFDEVDLYSFSRKPFLG
jgi:hypothetical protein